MQVQIAKIAISKTNRHNGNKTTLGYLDLFFKTKKKTSQDLGKGSGRFPFNQKFQNFLKLGVGERVMVQKFCERILISEWRTFQTRIEKTPLRSSGC